MDLRVVLVVALFGVCAVGAGGFLTTFVFDRVDRGHQLGGAAQETPEDDDVSTDAQTEGAHPAPGGVEQAGAVLRGGAWIGALERLAIFAGLVSGWPEAIAIVLAVKGLGRYPELRSGENSAVAERFIIGTFVSVLWACGCAGLAMWLR